MATRKPASKRTKPTAEMTDEEKRLAQLEAATRAAEAAGGRRDADEADDADDSRDADDADDADDKRDADDADDADDSREADDADDADDDADDKRDADDPDAEDNGHDQRAASKGAKRKGRTATEVRKAAEAAVRADRLRGAKIREIAAQFGLPKLGERHAADETSVRAFKDLVLTRLADRQRKRGDTTFAATGTSEVDEAKGARSQGGLAHVRDFDKGAEEARALLGKKAA